jgi:lysozyme
MRQYSRTGLELTKQFESCRLSAYQDQRGVWTIGWGTTYYPSGRRVQPGDTCTQLQADSWLMQAVQHSELVVNRALTVQAATALTQEEFDAVVDFVYNVGSQNFLGSTLLRFLNLNDFAAAANEFEKWDHVNGVEVAGLLRRREAEEKEFDSTSVDSIHPDGVLPSTE